MRSVSVGRSVACAQGDDEVLVRVAGEEEPGTVRCGQVGELRVDAEDLRVAGDGPEVELGGNGLGVAAYRVVADRAVRGAVVADGGHVAEYDHQDGVLIRRRWALARRSEPGVLFLAAKAQQGGSLPPGLRTVANDLAAEVEASLKRSPKRSGAVALLR